MDDYRRTLMETYEELTGKRITNQANSWYEKKIDELMGDETQAEPEAPDAPTEPEGKEYYNASPNPLVVGHLTYKHGETITLCAIQEDNPRTMAKFKRALETGVICQR